MLTKTSVGDASSCAHGWKPSTMKAPVLISFAISSVVIIALLEFLAERSQKLGGLSLVDEADEIPSAVNLTYLYLPTIIAVLYSLVWSWIDLDVKRMQPWTEVSKPDGATGRRSVFLDYPVDFVAFVPFKAAKQRHWAVFYSGTVMVLIFWMITPLQSSILGNGPVLMNKTVTMSAPSMFMDSLTQATYMDQSVMNSGYAMAWLERSYPPFTTPDYTLMPFQPAESVQGNVANYSGITTKYWTDLKCWPAEIEHKPKMVDGYYNFINGMGCNASSIPAHSTRNEHQMMYIGYQDSAWGELALSWTCSDKAFNQFLATWGRFDNITGARDMQALFCETSYYKQNVSALVLLPGNVPVDDQITPLSPPEPLQVTEFNSSAFEYLVGNGMSSVDVPRDWPFSHLLDFYTRLTDFGLPYPFSPMMGLMVGMNNYTVDAYRNTTLMGESYRSAHKMMFSMAFHTMLVNNTSPHLADGNAFVVKYGIIVSRVFTALVEGGLALVAVLTLVLLWVCHGNPTLLSSDPASLGSLIALVQKSPRLLSKFNGKGNLTADQLKDQLGDCTFKLTCRCQDASGATKLELLEIPSQAQTGLSQTNSGQAGSDQTGHYLPIKPFALRKVVGVLFAVCLCAAVAVFSYLRHQDTVLGGLVRPSPNFEVNQLLTSYLPTIFSTLVEPFWVMLNRYLCLLQPFYDLTSGRGTARRTIKARYTALPPQLALWRAFRSGHLLLGAICIIALLANVLAVGLGAIFNDNPIQKVYPVVMLPQKQARLDEKGLNSFNHGKVQLVPTDYEDPEYNIMANMSYGAPLPPWTTSEFTYLPVNITSDTPPSDDDEYTVVTTGFGVEPNCISMGNIITQDVPPTVNTSFGRTDPLPEGCAKEYVIENLPLNHTMFTNFTGRAAAEVASSMQTGSGGGGSNITDCLQSFLVGFSRSDITNDSTGTLNTSLVVCHPAYKVADFRVIFDSAGYIKNATPVSDFTSSIPYPDSYTHLPIISDLFSRLQDTGSRWHNDSVTHGWVMYMIKLFSGNAELFDPAMPTPEPEQYLDTLTSVYKALFVIHVTLNQYVFTDAENGTTVIGNRTVTETRIFVSSTAFITSTTILGLYILMVFFFYGWGVTFFLPRMPTNIGSLIAYIAPSKLTREYGESESEGEEDVVKDGEVVPKYSFGRFVGSDGKAHIGIDYSDRVVPVNPTSLERGDTRQGPGFLKRRLMGEKRLNGHETGNWL
ncbi:hypothetical protein BBK36DRAFT_1186748 [Trichoderma citrinoviride]|uniref:Uncharacterized protein n=1 Tax=Trichoderma citrinoviride TaxID=58853 RepID=A0A2T4BJ21_9HYPO|nr:hypothetical protein BBK36DRAFT_1186748 [Trichoderma citrinoviride]PTB69316.1 hypothetical protein BBK36DRAFT_1186748 [Trichoderma citrinoviride]